MIRELDHAQRVTIIVIPKYRKDPRDPRKQVLTSYHIVARDPLRIPQRIQRSLHEKDELEAKAKASHLKQLVRIGDYDFWEGLKDPLPSQRPSSCADAVEEYLEKLKARPSPNGLPIRGSTHQAYSSVLNGFARWVEDQLYPGIIVCDIKSDHMNGYVYGRAHSLSTMATQLNTVKGFFDWCVERKYIRSNPASSLKVRRPAGRTGYFQRAQYEGFLEHLGRRARNHRLQQTRAGCLVLRRAMILGVGTGLRRGEICALRWEDVDLSVRGRERVHVVDSIAHRTKNGHSRSVPVAGEALELLKELRAAALPGNPYVLEVKGEPIKEHRLTTGFRREADRAGLPRYLTFHSTRHTYATWLAQGGVGELLLQKLLGHSTGEMSQRYMHASAEDGRAAVQHVFGAPHQEAKGLHGRCRRTAARNGRTWQSMSGRVVLRGRMCGAETARTAHAGQSDPF